MSGVQTRSLADVHRTYRQLGCLGRGGFGSVFLAEKRSSGRRVALKIMLVNEEDEEEFGTFKRELDAVVKLNSRGEDDSEADGEKRDNRDMSIIFFHEGFVSSVEGFACIVMNFVDGGSLLQEIMSRAAREPFVPYSERRIAWYLLQMTEALAFAHERGIAHHDVKSANVLTDWSGGGRLVLADFGTSVVPGEETVGFSPLYAAPELIAAHKANDYSRLCPDKVDAFGLGCILFELLACQPLESFSDTRNLAEMVSTNAGVDAILVIPWMRLPWLPKDDQLNGTVGYSYELKSLVTTLLAPVAEHRWIPSSLAGPMRNDPKCPLLRSFVMAAEPMVPGTPVTVDNIQLGMFVQRGPDWEEDDLDGGVGSIGVVVKLDADAGYTEVAWPPSDPAAEVHTSCYRIGERRKHEIQVGPTPLPDFYERTAQHRHSGLLSSRDPSRYSVGQIINENCVVVGMDLERSLIFVAPTGKINVSAVPVPKEGPPEIKFAPPCEPKDVPSSWDLNLGLLAEVMDEREREEVRKLLFSPSGGLSAASFEVVSVRRVQSNPLWSSYAQIHESIAIQNWGVANERRLFHGTSETRPDVIVNDPVGFDPRFCDGGKWGRGSYFSSDALYSHSFAHKPSDGVFQMFLARVTLGRIYESPKADSKIRRPPHGFHSVSGLSALNTGVSSFVFVTYETQTQALPEYLITYKTRPPKGVGGSNQQNGPRKPRRKIKARRPKGFNG